MGGASTLSPFLLSPGSQSVGPGLHFPFMMHLDSPSLLQMSYLHFSLPLPPTTPTSLPPSTSTGSCCSVSLSCSLAPPRPAHQAPAGLLFVSQAAQGQQSCLSVAEAA